MPRKPQTMIHPETGETLRRGTRSMTVSYKGLEKVVTQPGWYPKLGDDGVLIGEDLAPAEAALAELKERDRLETASRVKAIRQRLKLSQRQAGIVLGGGARSFQKYESGEVRPSEPMLNLLRLLDRNPQLLKDLAG